MRPNELARWINWVLWPAIGAVALCIFILSFTIYLSLSTEIPHIAEQKKILATPEQKNIEPEIVAGVHLATGLIEGEGLQVVINNCTNCHSAKLITQNRMSSERWRQTIHWMQRTQNLWDLGVEEDVIVSYLSTYYAPELKGRRQQISDIDWYRLENK